MKRKNPIVQLLAEQRLGFEVLSATTAEEVIGLWWKSFSTPDSDSAWFNRKIYWQCFSFRKKPCLEFDAAIREYEAIAANKVWLLAVSESVVVFEVQKRSVPVSVLQALQERYLLDLYVFDKLASWTFVRTHEHECMLGPYFSRREWKLVSRKNS